MNKFYCLLFFSCFISVIAFAQTDTSVKKKEEYKKDSIQLVKDTSTVKDSMLPADSTAIKDSLRVATADSAVKMPIIKVSTENEIKNGIKKKFSGKEYLFYYIIFLLLLFGLLRMAFAKYFNDLFRVFFRTTLKQKQVREQLLQSSLPSVLMNCFFVLSAGLYVNFLLLNFKLSIAENFWLQYVYCTAALAFIYIVKFLGLKITGWLFNVNEAAESYTFIVFIICKMAGIYLLPFLVFLAFTAEPVYTNCLILSWIGLGLLFGYRFILSYSAARNEIKLNPFHFILYIIAFEIIPLLLIYRLLLFIF